MNIKNIYKALGPGLLFAGASIGTIIMTICFVSLGALVMHGSREQLSANGSLFAGQLVNICIWKQGLKRL